MARSKESYTGMMAARCYKLLSYAMTGKKFTIKDVCGILDCSPKTALRHVDGMSLCFPLIEVGTRPGGIRGPNVAVFQMIKDD